MQSGITQRRIGVNQLGTQVSRTGQSHADHRLERRFVVKGNFRVFYRSLNLDKGRQRLNRIGIDNFARKRTNVEINFVVNQIHAAVADQFQQIRLQGNALRKDRFAAAQIRPDNRTVKLHLLIAVLDKRHHVQKLRNEISGKERNVAGLNNRFVDNADYLAAERLNKLAIGAAGSRQRNFNVRIAARHNTEISRTRNLKFLMQILQQNVRTGHVQFQRLCVGIDRQRSRNVAAAEIQLQRIHVQHAVLQIGADRNIVGTHAGIDNQLFNFQIQLGVNLFHNVIRNRRVRNQRTGFGRTDY